MIAWKITWVLSLVLLLVSKSQASRIIRENLHIDYDFPDCGEDSTLNEENVCVPIVYEEREFCQEVPRQFCSYKCVPVRRQRCEAVCETLYDEKCHQVCETLYDVKCGTFSVPINCGKDKTINSRNKCVSKSKAIAPQTSPDYFDYDSHPPSPPLEDSYGAAAAPVDCGENETLDNQNNCVPKSKAILPQGSIDYDFGDYSNDFYPPPPAIPSTTQPPPEETYSLRSMINRFFGLPF